MSMSGVLGVNAPWSARAASMPGSAVNQTKVNDRDLKAFVNAYVEYQRIKRRYETRIRALKDESAKRKLEQEGNQKVRYALERQGLTPQHYNELFTAVNGDPQLRRRALDLIQAERQNS